MWEDELNAWVLIYKTNDSAVHQHVPPAPIGFRLQTPPRPSSCRRGRLAKIPHPGPSPSSWPPGSAPRHEQRGGGGSATWAARPFCFSGPPANGFAFSCWFPFRTDQKGYPQTKTDSFASQSKPIIIKMGVVPETMERIEKTRETRTHSWLGLTKLHLFGL